MKADIVMPDILDFAYQVIGMHNQITALEYELDDVKKQLEFHQEMGERSGEHTKEMLGIMINGIIDPESSINKGDRAIHSPH